MGSLNAGVRGFSQVAHERVLNMGVMSETTTVNGVAIVAINVLARVYA
jgi:hypothetical protein